MTVSDVFERRLALEADLPEPRQQRMRQMFNYVVDEIAQDGSNGVAEEPAQ